MRFIIIFLTIFCYNLIYCDVTKSDIVFTSSIFKKITSSQKNVVFSPLSLKVILALIQFGCKGESKSEIERIFNLEEGDQIEKVYKDLTHENEKYILSLNSRFYIKNGIPINHQFQQFANQIFDVQIENVDFGRKEETAELINYWAAQKTNNRVQNLVVPSVLDNHASGLFINTVYFKGDWKVPFPVAFTKPMDFYLGPGEVVPVEMMSLQEKTFKYGESAALGCRFLQVPFKEKGDYMVVVLPDRVTGLGGLQNQIRNVLRFDNFTKNIVNVGLPKFRIESSTSFKRILKKLGINQIFEPSKADLSGIAGKKGDIFVDEILQKSFLDVQETGVEGGSGTFALVAIPISLPSNVKNFKVDRPFLFYIKVKNNIVFIGKITDPRI